MSAAVAGGALAAFLPSATIAGPALDAAAGEAALRLTSDGQQLVPEPVARPVTLVADIAPVRELVEPEPAEVSVGELIKAAGLADVARKAEEAKVAREAAARCDAALGGLGRVKPWVRDAAQFLSCLYDQPTLIGVAQRSRASDHPSGLAVDIMARGAQGDRIAECALANRQALGISYVIWNQRVNYGDGWELMSDRGGITANHKDHVHISFNGRPGSGDALADRCG